MLDYIRKHWQVAREAYKAEKENASARLPIHQKDFLPAALEILETPPSPAGRTTVWLTLSFFSIAMLWSYFGKIDVVATAQGKVVPLGQTKVIQSIETGVVRDIAVENGSHVKKGDVLIELDATFSTADIESLSRKLESATVTRVRGKWLLSYLRYLAEEKQIAKEENKTLAPELHFPENISVEVQDVQRMLAKTQLSEYIATKASLEKQLEQRLNEEKVIRGSLAKLVETLPLLEEQVRGVTELEKNGVYPRFQYLEYEERLISRKRDIDIERDKVKQVLASIQAIEKQIEQHKQEFQKTIVSELAEATDQVVAVEQELTKAQKTNNRQTIIAPVDGIVQQLTINTLGGVVKAGDPLMVVVPAERVLQVEASVLNKDIGFVSEGQAVEIKLEAFPFTKFGVIHGEILSIDHDAVQNEDLGLIYPARMSLEEETILVKGKTVPITPGMSLTAEVKTGKRRIIEFVLSPLLRYKDESLRER